MSAKKERERRREERLAAEAAEMGASRRRLLLRVSAALGAIALVGVILAVVLMSVSGGDKGDDPTKVSDVAEVRDLLAGIPQHGATLGDAEAKVHLFEYGDLQCPFCKEDSEETLPGVIKDEIATGKADITFRNFTIIGPDSVTAGAAMLAAGAQGKGWNFLLLWYRNQGDENSGYVTDNFIEAIGRAAGIPDMARWNRDRKSQRYTGEVQATTRQAQRLGLASTPYFAIEGPGSDGLELLGTPKSPGSVDHAIEAVE